MGKQHQMDVEETTISLLQMECIAFELT